MKLAPYLFPKPPKPALAVTSEARAFSFKPEKLDHAAIIKKLDVLKNRRYIASGGLTYCNIAAHDFATLFGVYLPRVWWTDSALREKDYRIIYGKTVRELNANALVGWFDAIGPEFGWSRSTVADAQQHVNKGGFAVIAASRKDRSASGHITVIVPGEIENAAPNQWQAGARNFESTHSKWYQAPHYDKWGVWINSK